MSAAVAFSALLLSLLAAVVPAVAEEPVDSHVVAFLREHGLGHSQVLNHLGWLSDVFGSRLTGSPSIKQAQQWARGTLERWGMNDSRFEEWGPFGRGWSLQGFSMRVITDSPWVVHGYPRAWSPPLEGPVEAEVVAVGELTDAELQAADLTGKIVLIQAPRVVAEPFTGTAQRLDTSDLHNLTSAPDDRRTYHERMLSLLWSTISPRALQTVYSKRPLALIDCASQGDYGTIFVSGAIPPPPQPRHAVRFPNVTGVVPQFTMAVEHYNRVLRTLRRRVPVRMELALDATFHDDEPMERNVVADIPGTDPEVGQEVVLLGAHIDSWHAGTGATDNGAGTAVVMEAISLILKLMRHTGTRPRRTIRIGLWSGEEQSLLGARAYVQQHLGDIQPGRGGARRTRVLLPEHKLLSAYYNFDDGTGRVRGIYTQGNPRLEPIFAAWLRPFYDLGAGTVVAGFKGGSDHVMFDRMGLPGLMFLQDPVAYKTKTHHSNMDTLDHVVADDLKQAAVVVASFVWHTAQRDERLPRM